MRRSRSVGGGGGGRPSLATRVVKSNLPVSNNNAQKSSNARSSSGGRFSTGQGSNNRYSAGGSRSSSVGRSTNNNQQNMRKSSFSKPGIPGIGGKQRTSGYGRTFGGSDTMKDPRPLFDKGSGYRDSCIKRLVDFLLDRHFPHKISTRILHSPATKEVVHIFEFLYSFIQPGYTMKNKHEEEIPRLMKMLEYPFNLTKNMMFTIGAPHTWPNVLGALIWLVEFIQGAINTDIEGMLFPREADDFEIEPESLILFNYYAKSYGMFMGGADTFTEVEEDLLNSLKTRYAGCGGSVDQLAETNRRLMAELDELQKEPDRLASVQEYHYNITRDFTKFKEYIEKMDMVRVNLAKKLAETEEELNNSELEMQRLSKDVEHKRYILETQTISQIDVQRINRGSQELRRQNEALQREISENEKQIWTFEMGMGKRQEKIDGRCQSHGQLLLKLKMILPPDAYINIDDLKCDPSCENIKKSIVKERFLKNLDLSQTKSHETLAKLHHETELLEQVKETEEEKDNSLESMERRLETLNTDFEVKKEAMMKEESQMKTDYSQHHQKNNELRQDLMSSSADEVSARLRECQARLERRIEEARQGKYAWIKFLEEVIGEVVEHKQILQKTYHKLKDEFGAMHTEEKQRYQEENAAVVQC